MSNDRREDPPGTAVPVAPGQAAAERRARARAPRGGWSLAGVVAGVAGMATSYAAATVLVVRESPVVALAEGIVRLVPGAAVEQVLDLVGAAGKPLLVLGVTVALLLLFAAAGRLARGGVWAPLLLGLGLAGVAAIAVATGPVFTPIDLVPVAVAALTWVLLLPLLAAPLVRLERAAVRAEGVAGHDRGAALPATTRRTFLVRVAAVGAGAGLAALAGRLLGQGHRAVERMRRLLRLPITPARVPDGVAVDVEGMPPWRTPNDAFYLVHTAIVVPTIDPERWQLRVHGMVERELRISFSELVAREVTEQWITLSCVSNPVGGDLVGNAWWSGVRLADVLAEAGVHPGADAVLQTSQDGWTCATPLAALTDDRGAMLAVGMNGEPLPIEHGFPVRTVVPGLYGYVSATKWLVDLEVTRFDRVAAYWTRRGWAELGPVKISSRIDVPRSGEEVEPGRVRVGGVAWAQTTGIAAVEVAVDGGRWSRAELAAVPDGSTWVQWAATVELEPGPHVLRVRAVDRAGRVQTGVETDALPDGATGWHEIEVTASR